MKTVDKFMSKVLKTNKCWIWLAAKNAKGYGTVGETENGKFKTKLAHRVAYERFVGHITPGLCVLHKCDVRSCVNPSHLMLGTQDQNIKDRQEKGRQKKGEMDPQHKLSSSEVAEMRMMYKHGIMPTELSRRFGVCRSRVTEIVSGKAWKHLVDPDESVKMNKNNE